MGALSDRQKGPNQIRVQEVQSGRQARGQGRQNGQASGYKVQKQQGSKPGGLEKGECKKQENGKNAG